MNIQYLVFHKTYNTVIKLITIAVEHLKLLFHPVIVNAFVFYDANKQVRHENWGDDINYYFLREVVKRPIVLLNRTSLAIRFNLKNYLVIGSTIDMLCKANTEVWGAGIIDDNKPLSVKPKKVYAVRGPLTRDKLLRGGVICPDIQGDPSLLIPLYYHPQRHIRYKYGIIPHVSNQSIVDDMLMEGMRVSESRDIQIIRLGQYKYWHDIIDQICECENILSSSLHGLILAEAYGVPNVWIEFGKSLIGGHFKFHDFFLSIHRDREKPIVIERNKFPKERIDLELSNWEQGYIDLKPLIKACPFKLKKPKYPL